MKAQLVSFLVSLCLLISPVKAEETKSDLMTAATVLIVADWAQTRYMVNNGYRELNPLLGGHPSIGRVNVHFASMLLAGHVLYWNGFLPNSFLYVFVSLEATNIVRNYQLGIRFNF